MPTWQSHSSCKYTWVMQDNYCFPLHIRMHLVPEINTVLNMQDQMKVKKLHMCQLMWHSSKLMTICMWEIELLDDVNAQLGIPLRDAMMWICHSSKPKICPLSFYQLAPERWLPCTYDAEISGFLCTHDDSHHNTVSGMYAGNPIWLGGKIPNIAKWFKLAVRMCTADAYWLGPMWIVCIQQEQWHLSICYCWLWCPILGGQSSWTSPPKCKCIQVDEEWCPILSLW